MTMLHKFSKEKLWKSRKVVINNPVSTVITAIEDSSLVNLYAVSTDKYLQTHKIIVAPPSVGPD
jgi:hypothetical protein